MSSRSFRSVFMVASCAGAALGCYLVSLRVASERASLENVETEIVMAQRDIRVLQTEIGTRGRLAQLERWNVKVLALSAPSADQFLDGGFALAKMVAPRANTVDLQAPVVLASAPANTPRPQLQGNERAGSDDEPEGGASAREMMHVASIKRSAPQVAEDPMTPVKPAGASGKSAQKPVATKAPAKALGKGGAKTPSDGKSVKASAAKPKLPASDRKAAAAEPLAATSAKTKKIASSAPTGPRKENGSKQ
jgi:hypothetical protein